MYVHKLKTLLDPIVIAASVGNIGKKIRIFLMQEHKMRIHTFFQTNIMHRDLMIHSNMHSHIYNKDSFSAGKMLLVLT